MIKLIVLDWDDCIIQGSSEAYYASYTQAIRDSGIEIDQDVVKKHVRELWGRPHRTVIESIIGTENPKLDDVVHSYEHLISTDFFSKHLSLIPGARDTLLLLKVRYALAIATGMNAAPLKEQLIPHFELKNIFASVISSSELSDSSRGKPYPDMLLKLMEDLAVTAQETLMVGDGKSDVFMAKAASVEPVVVLTGQLTKEEAEHLGVQHIIPSVADLPSLLELL